MTGKNRFNTGTDFDCFESRVRDREQFVFLFNISVT